MNYEFREDLLSILKELSKVAFMPVAVGGKINNLLEAKLELKKEQKKL